MFPLNLAEYFSSYNWFRISGLSRYNVQVKREN